jgi:hypothetical protein
MRGFLRLSAISVAVFALLAIGSAQASESHTIVFLKGCASPVPVGDQLSCTVRIMNTLDSTHDTIRVTGLVDTVNGSGGQVSGGNVLSSTALVFSGPVSCVGGTGAGTPASPYIGATQCQVPFGASIEAGPIAVYAVQPGDVALPDHRLTDSASLTWNNTCGAATFGCTTAPQVSTAVASAIVGTGPQSIAYHGIAFTKDCATPVVVGNPNLCSWNVANVLDTAHDTMRVSGLTDIVHAALGEVNSGNILASVPIVFNGPVSCSGGSGAGTPSSPYVGATECLLPFGSSITTRPFSHYVVGPSDFDLIPGHALADTSQLTWNDTCTGGTGVGDCLTQLQASVAVTVVQVELAAYTFLGFTKPPADTYKAGKFIDLRFMLGDGSGTLLADADASALVASCGVTASIAGLPPACATYVADQDRFRVKLDTPKSLAPGQYEVTIAVAGAVVQIKPVTITGK